MNDVIPWLGFAVGLVLVGWTASGILRSLVVPRGLASRLSVWVERFVRKTFIFIANRMESYEAKDRVLATQAPTFLITQLFAWISLLLLGFALLLWPLIDGSFGQALIESGSSMFTLGYAGTHTVGGTIVHFIAAAAGLGVVALLIAYLPTIYSAFNRRETLVTTLQSRAGVPAWGPEILVRHQMVDIMENLQDFYSEWERWAADVSESHTNYPVLLWMRSPHPLRSWIIALLSVLDSAALYLAACPNAAPTDARLCLRMGFTCLRNIADFLRMDYDPDPLPTDDIQLTFEEFHGGYERLESVNFPVERSAEEAWAHFKGWRVNYEAIAYAIGDLIVAPPGPWAGPRKHLPGMAFVPQRPANRSPDDPTAKGRPKAERFGWHA